MQVIEKGKYLANAVLTEFPSMRAQDIDFSSKDISFVSIVPIWSNISLQQGAVYLAYSNSYDPVNDVYAVTVVYTYATATWSNEAYRTVSVAQNTEVTNTVKTWFDANYTLLSESDEDPELDPEPLGDLKPVYKMMNGTWKKVEAFETQNGEWIQISSAQKQEA